MIFEGDNLLYQVKTFGWMHCQKEAGELVRMGRK